MLTILNIKLMPGIGDPFEFKILDILSMFLIGGTFELFNFWIKLELNVLNCLNDLNSI